MAVESGDLHRPHVRRALDVVEPQPAILAAAPRVHLTIRRQRQRVPPLRRDVGDADRGQTHGGARLWCVCGVASAKLAVVVGAPGQHLVVAVEREVVERAGGDADDTADVELAGRAVDGD